VKEFCIANLVSLSVWNFASTQEEAEAKLIEANTTGLYKESGKYEITTWENFQAVQRSRLLKPIKEITENKFDFAIGCLPPLSWHNTNDGLNVFFMSEFWTGSFTNQYAMTRTGKTRFFKKMVDYKDKSTWITADEIKQFVRAKRKAKSEKFIKDNKEVLTKLIEEV